MKEKLFREITPLTQSDCFTVHHRTKSEFDFPLHFHEEFELNFIHHAKSAMRVIGDHKEEIGELELVLVGPNVQHGWFNHNCRSRKINEITIQFHRDLLDDKLLLRNQMNFIREMFQRSMQGVLFSTKTIEAIMPRLMQFTQKSGFDSVLELLSILHDLSISRDMRILSATPSQVSDSLSYNSTRIDKVLAYTNKNFEKKITLSEVSKLASMTDVAFSRFFKARTGKTFVDTLNDIRLGHASRLLIDTTQSIGEIAYRCGFNNMSNFNRIFKKKKDCTPKEFRMEYNGPGIRTFV